MGQYSRKLKKGARWFYSGQYLGQKYHSKAIFLTKRECAGAERDKLKELDELARSPVVAISLLDLFTHRLDYLNLTRNQEYYRDNKRLCKQMLQAWGNIIANDVTKRMVSDLVLNEVKRCKKENLTNSRPNKLFTAARACFNYAITRLGIEMKNPCDGLSKLPEDRSVNFIPTEEMITEVKEICSPAQQLLIQFVYDTASRINEAISLSYNDVADKHVVLYTRKSKNSARSPRFVPKPEYIKPGGEGKVFKEWDAYPRFLEDKVKSLKHPAWNWHGLRRRRASIWANEDMPLFQIMMLLGHSQISTTQRYLFSLGIIKT